MAKLTNELEATVKLGGEDVNIYLRNPSNEEMNDFLSKRYDVSANKKGGKVKDNSLLARANFFDNLVSKIENLEDAEGKAITAERKELIPSKWKNDII